MSVPVVRTPEVLAGDVATGVTVTPASDVYMLGGLMFEVLTCGLTPYYWLHGSLVAQVCFAVCALRAWRVGVYALSTLLYLR